ncbi:MAG: anaerobic ribonucleoside-triphosphate reductase activating protein [Candidatus Thermoplasmatota archaeon]|nr:anaerobic ribonucleoside-triphosphate reductase activating protein [Candidatus Thermoplasmatota archaeon]
MKIGGFQKLSLIDYPYKLSAVVWTIGCNLRCPFCYNHNLIDGSSRIQEEEVISTLDERKNFLEGVSISGGEPTLQEGLIDFLREVKQMDYLVKIDTNGTRPEMISKLLEKDLLDYIAIDVKAPKGKYDLLVGTEIDIQKIERSIEIVHGSNVSYEFRTTVVPGLLDEKDIGDISEWLGKESRYILQQFEHKKDVLDPDKITERSYSEEKLERWSEKYFEDCKLRL